MKGRYALFIRRTKVCYDLLIIYAISIISFISDSQTDYHITLVSSILSFLYLAYFEYLNAQKKKISFFYNGRNLSQLRFYAIKSTILLSLVFLPVLFLLGRLSGNFIIFIVEYFLTILSFYLVTRFFPLTIEKKRGKKIMTLQDIFKNILCSLMLLVLLLGMLYSAI